MDDTLETSHWRSVRIPEPVKKYMPFIIFGVLLLLLFLSIQITGSRPVITGIEPKIGQPGQVLLVSGRHFGKTRGRVSISGIVPVSSAYLEWSSDQRKVAVDLQASWCVEERFGNSVA